MDGFRSPKLLPTGVSGPRPISQNPLRSGWPSRSRGVGFFAGSSVAAGVAAGPAARRAAPRGDPIEGANTTAIPVRSGGTNFLPRGDPRSGAFSPLSHGTRVAVPPYVRDWP